MKINNIKNKAMLLLVTLFGTNYMVNAQYGPKTFMESKGADVRSARDAYNYQKGRKEAFSEALQDIKGSTSYKEYKNAYEDLKKKYETVKQEYETTRMDYEGLKGQYNSLKSGPADID